MDKDEAIERLKGFDLIGSNEDIEFQEALDMAIEALEQEPCGKDINVSATGAISRQAVLETIDNRIEQIKKDANEINKYYSHLSFSEGVHDGYCRLKCDLQILPSVTPQPRSEVLDKIRDEIEKQDKWLAQAGYTAYNVDIALNSIKRVIAESEE